MEAEGSDNAGAWNPPPEVGEGVNQQRPPRGDGAVATSVGVYRGGAIGPRPVRVEIPAPVPMTVPTPSAGELGRGAKTRWLWRHRPAGASSGAPGAGGTSQSGLVERVLRARGVLGARADAGELAAFLGPKLSHLHEPSLIPDLDRAAARILDAVKSGEPIAIYGDYDVDGITATAILWHTLLSIEPSLAHGGRLRTYVPHRDEGYGLNVAAVEQLAAEGRALAGRPGVIISVDCGVTAMEPALAARRAGVDLIITDHHNPPQTDADLPAAFAVVHPRRPGSAYPFGDLSGAGVAFKLAWKLGTLAGAGDGRSSAVVRQTLLEMLPLAALGAIADVVPLVGENRVLAHFGLARAKQSPLVGLKALIHESRLDGERVSAWDVGFKLAPRLNACGRLTHAAAAIELFTTAGPERAQAIASELDRQNTRRRAVEKRIFEQACEQVEARGLHRDEHRVIVLADKTEGAGRGDDGEVVGWHHGVVGIVCSRLVERFGRPTVLLCTDGDDPGLLRGSGRSIDGFSLHGALEACRHQVVSFGGHDMAAGVKVRRERFEDFALAMGQVARERLEPHQLVPATHVDVACSVDELSLREVKGLEELEPFGRGNPPVVVLLPDVRLLAAPTPLGKGGEHLSLMVEACGVAAGPGASTVGSAGPARGRRGAPAIRLLAWRMGERRDEFRAGMRLDVLVKPKVNEWNGRQSVEPEIVDFRVIGG